jgi:hypothetical protein
LASARYGRPKKAEDEIGWQFVTLPAHPSDAMKGRDLRSS